MAYDREGVSLRVRAGIAETGMSLRAFAKANGMSFGTVQAWCTGRSGFTLENAVAFCDAVGWPLDRLACRGDWERAS